MKYPLSVLRSIILLTLILLLFSCATTSQVHKESESQTIDMGSYTVSAPPMKSGLQEIPPAKWEVSIEKEKEVVKFQKIRKNLFGEILDTTLIRVFRNAINQAGWHLSEEEVANDFRNTEEKIMIEEGVKKKLYDLKDLKRHNHY